MAVRTEMKYTTDIRPLQARARQRD